jgi:hypothetical protein
MVFKKYSQRNLQTKREALRKLNRKGNDREGFCHSDGEMTRF